MVSRTSVTIEDVAREAGVSRAAVSKVIRNAYGVSDAMRERVQTAIDTLGYRPSIAARAMRGSTYTIGIELPATDNPFFHTLLKSMNAALSDTDFQTIISPIVGRDEGPLALQRLADRQVDGIVAVAPRSSREWLEEFSAHKPLVLVGHHFDAVNFDSVVNDDFAGGRLVVEHLVSLGHRNIVMISVPHDPEPSREASPHWVRSTGYRKAMEEAGLGHHSRVIFNSSDAVDEARQVTLELLDGPNPPTAIFAGHDQLAMGVLWARAERNLSPAELSVVGYDNTDMSAHPLISLTSVDQSAHLFGRRIVALLLERIAGRTEAVHETMTPSLRRRNSSQAPARP